jgi:serine/threonine protein kinase/tetratricopeptide (TPR) repeat protein
MHAAVPFREDEIGSIGPYRLINRISAGGMGVVYRARHAETGELVALKTVRVPEAVMLRGIRREIHALRRIQHPGIVRVVAEGVQDGLPWYAMELLQGLTLRSYIEELWRRDALSAATADTAVVSVTEISVLSGTSSSSSYGPPPEAQRRPAAMQRVNEVVTLGRRLCSTLAFLHGEGLVHRDLKPENIFIRPDGTPVLFDFGLASVFGGPVSREALEVSGSLEGSFIYMAPEQIKGSLVDARADLYALGCILYELFVGQPPFGGTGWEVLRRHLQEAPLSPSRWVTGLPPELEATLLKLLAKVPRERIGYAADVGTVLAELGGEDLNPPPTQQPRHYLYRPEFVGRQSLIAQLDGVLEQTRHGEGGSLLIGAESGAGKTRLLMECAVSASRRAFRVITSGCLPLSGNAPGGREVHGEPLHAFKPLLQALADECRQKGLEETERLLGERGPVLALYEPSFRELPGQDAHPEPPRLPPPAARERFMQCLADTLSAFSHQDPLLLIVDDLQWADELSLSVMASLQQSGFLPRSRVLVAGTYRKEELGPALQALLDVHGVLKLELGQLDAPQVARMVEDMLAMSSPPSSFVHFLTTRSAGNPFFVAEYLRTAIDERLVHRDPFGQWRLGTGNVALEHLHQALPLPGTLRDVVGRRLHGLAPEVRGLLEVASVLGRELEGEVLAGAAGLGDFQELEALEELRARHVLEDIGGGRLRFVHDKLREMAYAGIAPERRPALHRAAALAIESRCTGEEGVPPALYATLAHHWEQAGDDVWTFEYLEKAGTHALRAGANREASSYLRRAVELDAERGANGGVRVDAFRRARWERLLGEAAHGLSDFPGSREHSLEAMEGLGWTLPRTTGGWVALLLREAVQQLLHLLLPQRWVKARASRETALGGAALASLRLTECYYWSYDVLPMVATAFLAVNLAERAGRGHEVLRLYGQLGAITGMGRLFPLSRHYFRRAQGEGLVVQDPSATAMGFILESMHLLGFGRWDAAATKAGEAQRVLLRLGDRAEYELAQVLLGHTDYFTGRFEATLRLYAEVRESARARGHLQHEAWGAYTLARSLIALGRMDEAVELLREARAMLPMEQDRLSDIILGGLLAQVHLHRGELEAAREHAEVVQALARRVPPMLFSELHGYEGAALAWLGLWEHERRTAPGRPVSVAEPAREACARLSDFALRFPVAQPASLRCSGMLAWFQDKPRQARSAWRKALKVARELDMPYEEALAHLALARASAPGSPERAAHEQEARALFTRMGCEGRVREVEALP